MIEVLEFLNGEDWRIEDIFKIERSTWKWGVRFLKMKNVNSLSKEVVLKR